MGTSGTLCNSRPLGAFFIEPDLFDSNVPFGNTTPIYLINLYWNLWLELELNLKLHYFSIFHGEYENEHLIFREFHRR